MLATAKAASQAADVAEIILVIAAIPHRSRAVRLVVTLDTYLEHAHGTPHLQIMETAIVNFMAMAENNLASITSPYVEEQVDAKYGSDSIEKRLIAREFSKVMLAMSLAAAGISSAKVCTCLGSNQCPYTQ
jgi:ABC-type amino acid transport system permease subunit